MRPSPITLAVINVALALFLSPLLEGLIRKLRARIHSRIGPPVIQPYYDLLKLLGKEDINAVDNPILKIAPILALSSVMVASLLIPLGSVPPLGFYGDTIVFIYFIALAGVGIVLGGFVSASPYATVGAGREMIMFLIVEPVLFVTLITAAINSRSFTMYDMALWNYMNGPTISMAIAAVAYFLALQAQLSKLPFDIPEAETEIMGGPFVEMSGPKFALFKWSLLAKQVVFCSLFFEIFIPWPKTFNYVYDLIITLIKVIVAVLLIGVIDAVNPRLRIDQALIYFFGVIIVAIAGLAFALVSV